MRDSQLEPVVVTAQHYQERASQSPVSVSIISGGLLEDARVEDLRELPALAPNTFSFGQGNRGGNGRTYTIRGLSNTGGAGSEAAVSVYVDDVPFTDTYAMEHPLYDIERVEVIRGPRGALYGHSAEGGVIKIHTRDPGRSWSGSAGASAGSHRFRNGRLSLDGPLGESGKAGLALSGYYMARDGFMYNTFTKDTVDDWETLSGRARLVLDPTPELRAEFTVMATKLNDGGGIRAVPLDRGAYRDVWGVSLNDYEIWQDDEGRGTTDADTLALRLEYDLGWATAASVSTRSWIRSDVVNLDLGWNAATDMTTDVFTGFTAYTQTLQLTSTPERTDFSWVVGAMGSYKETLYENILYFGSAAPPGYSLVATDVDLERTSAAAFAQVSRRFFAETLGVTAGLRYERMNDAYENRAFDRMNGNAVGPVQTAEEDVSSSQFLPAASLDYRITPDHMVYVTAAKGYKPAGVAYASLDVEKTVYDEEIAWLYEAGAKTVWLDGALHLNAAVFHTDVADYQDVIWLDPNTSVYANAAEATLQGFEVEADYTPLPGLTLSAHLGFISAEYDDYRALSPFTGQVEDYSGNDIAWVPEYDYLLAAQYRSERGLFARAELQGVGPYPFDQANTREQDGYTVVNAKVGYETEWWDVYLFGKNLGDTRYTNFAFPSGMGYFMAAPGDPRLVGVDVTVRF